jgi:DDE domain
MLVTGLRIVATVPHPTKTRSEEPCDGPTVMHGSGAEPGWRHPGLGSDEHGQVIDVLLRDKRNRASAEAFSHQALARTVVTPKAVIADRHQPYVKAVATVLPLARHVRTGLHRCRGYTTQPIERSYVPTRDRLRDTRGLRTVGTKDKISI